MKDFDHGDGGNVRCRFFERPQQQTIEKSCFVALIFQ